MAKGVPLWGMGTAHALIDPCGPERERRSGMKRRVLCMLLALVLCVALLPVTAGAANENVTWLDISAGEINIYPNGYTVGNAGKIAYTGKYGLFQTKKEAHTVRFGTDGTYDVTLKGLQVTGEGLMDHAIWVSQDSVVNLTLDGDNLLDTRNVDQNTYSAITTFPGSTLNITGNGTLTTISSFWASIRTHGACQINISGENTIVKAYGMKYDTTTPFAIREYDFNTGSGDANLQLSVTDGATLEAYGGIRATKLKLDDTATLWSQAYRNGVPPALPLEVEYESSDTYLYYFSNKFLPRGVVDWGSAYRYLRYPNEIDPYSSWELLDTGALFIDGKELRQDVKPLSDELSMGSWALLKGKKAVTPTPPVTPKDPEGNLLQNLVGTGLFFVPDDFPFYDVDSNDWFYEPVKSAWQNDLIDGVTARYFKPDSTLTVAQAIKLAAALHQKQSVGFVTLQNGGTHWYDNYVNYAVANGLIEAAYQNKSAEDMNKAITRAEFVHILSKLLSTGAINTVNTIPDVKSGDAYADEIFAFYRAGILTGSDRLGTFHPESSLKRSEAAAILVRLYDATQRQYITLR